MPALERRMWKHYGLDGYDEWQGEDRSHGLSLPDDAEDAVAQEAAPWAAAPAPGGPRGGARGAGRDLSRSGRVKVTIIGTGRIGHAVGSRLLAGGHEVEFVGTHISKAQELADELEGDGAVGATETVRGEVAMLASPTPRRRTLSGSTPISWRGR